jgi:hypothetical protein
VLSVLLRYTDSDCPFGIFKLFLNVNNVVIETCIGNTLFDKISAYTTVFIWTNNDPQK